MMKTPFEIAQSALDDCCDFFPKFKGIERFDPLTAEYISQGLGLAESATCGEDGFEKLYPLVRAELIGIVLCCDPSESNQTLDRFATIWSEF